jgi:hypothetical protein
MEEFNGNSICHGACCMMPDMMGASLVSLIGAELTLAVRLICNFTSSRAAGDKIGGRKQSQIHAHIKALPELEIALHWGIMLVVN